MELKVRHFGTPMSTWFCLSVVFIQTLSLFVEILTYTFLISGFVAIALLLAISSDSLNISRIQIRQKLNWAYAYDAFLILFVLVACFLIRNLSQGGSISFIRAAMRSEDNAKWINISANINNFQPIPSMDIQSSGSVVYFVLFLSFLISRFISICGFAFGSSIESLGFQIILAKYLIAASMFPITRVLVGMDQRKFSSNFISLPIGLFGFSVSLAMGASGHLSGQLLLSILCVTVYVWSRQVESSLLITRFAWLLLAGITWFPISILCLLAFFTIFLKYRKSDLTSEDGNNRVRSRWLGPIEKLIFVSLFLPPLIRNSVYTIFPIDGFNIDYLLGATGGTVSATFDMVALCVILLLAMYLYCYFISEEDSVTRLVLQVSNWILAYVALIFFLDVIWQPGAPHYGTIKFMYIAVTSVMLLSLSSLMRVSLAKGVKSSLVFLFFAGTIFLTGSSTVFPVGLHEVSNEYWSRNKDDPNSAKFMSGMDRIGIDKIVIDYGSAPVGCVSEEYFANRNTPTDWLSYGCTRFLTASHGLERKLSFVQAYQLGRLGLIEFDQQLRIARSNSDIAQLPVLVLNESEEIIKIVTFSQAFGRLNN